MVIEVRSLVKSYEDVRALRGLSIDIAGGGLVGLLGPNGAGRRLRSVNVLGLDPQKSPGELRRGDRRQGSEDSGRLIEGRGLDPPPCYPFREWFSLAP